MAANIKYNPAGEDGLVDQVRERDYESDQPTELWRYADLPVAHHLAGCLTVCFAIDTAVTLDPLHPQPKLKVLNPKDWQRTNENPAETLAAHEVLGVLPSTPTATPREEPLMDS